MKGKEKCALLKKIREKIAKKNGIPYKTEECTAKGDCKGTCPKCDQEIQELNEALKKKEAEKQGKTKIPKVKEKKLSYAQKKKKDNFSDTTKLKIKQLEEKRKELCIQLEAFSDDERDFRVWEKRHDLREKLNEVEDELELLKGNLSEDEKRVVELNIQIRKLNEQINPLRKERNELEKKEEDEISKARIAELTYRIDVLESQIEILAEERGRLRVTRTLGVIPLKPTSSSGFSKNAPNPFEGTNLFSDSYNPYAKQSNSPENAKKREYAKLMGKIEDELENLQDGLAEVNRELIALLKKRQEAGETVDAQIDAINFKRQNLMSRIRKLRNQYAVLEEALNKEEGQLMGDIDISSISFPVSDGSPKDSFGQKEWVREQEEKYRALEFELGLTGFEKNEDGK